MSIANGSGLKWERVRRGLPCSVCEREDGLCAASTDGKYRACYREGGPGSEERTNKAGIPFFLHRMNGQAEDKGQAAKPVRKPIPARADADVLDDVYSALLSDPRLELTEVNVEDLARRGFPAEEARQRLYASMPARGREEIAFGLAKRFSKKVLLGVPGFVVNGRDQLDIASFPGLVIPSRDHAGRIVALIVRPDKPPDAKHKYLFVSSANRGGPSPGAPAHVPLGVAGRAATVRLTEGPLKADLATILSGEPTIAAPGVSNWRPCIRALKALEAKVIRLAFDADWRVNDKVAQALVACVEGLEAEGMQVEFETWDPDFGKGIDDVLAAGETPDVSPGDEAKGLLRSIVSAAFPEGRPAKPVSAPATSGKGGHEGKPPPPPKADVEGHLEHAFSDLGNARRLIQHYGADIRFCHDWKTWMLYAEGRWTRDRSGAVMAMAKMVPDYILAEPPPDCDPKRVASFKIWALESQSVKLIRAMVELARSDVPVHPEHFDACPWDFNMLNGTVDLRTGELKPHRREDMISKQAPVAYDPTATAPRFERFEREIFNGDEDLIHYVRRTIGYALTGDDSEQEINLWHGDGSNGKNVYADTVRALLGDYASAAESRLLLKKRNDDHPTGLADLQGKRFVTASETDDGRQIAEALVKQLTGDAVIKARKMHENFFEFPRSFKIFLLTNHKPMVKGNDHGIWRRIRLVPFQVKFVKEGEAIAPPLILEEDPNLKQQLVAEGPGIINLFIKACRDWQENGMRTPDAVKAATEAFRSEMDTVTGFLDERCKSHLGNPALVDKATVDKDRLFAAYEDWCDGNSLPKISPRKFGSEMTKRGYELACSNGRYFRRGLSLIDSRAEEPPERDRGDYTQEPLPDGLLDPW